jgi:hypothetical protein
MVEVEEAATIEEFSALGPTVVVVVKVLGEIVEVDARS